MSWTSMFKWATFREILLPSSEKYLRNTYMYIKTHYGETILAKIRKLEKTMIKYSSYAQWWEKYLSKRSPLKHTSSWHDKLIVLEFPSKIEYCVFIMHWEFSGSFPDYTIFICKSKTDECFSFMKRFWFPNSRHSKNVKRKSTLWLRLLL